MWTLLLYFLCLPLLVILARCHSEYSSANNRSLKSNLSLNCIQTINVSKVVVGVARMKCDIYRPSVPCCHHTSCGIASGRATQIVELPQGKEVCARQYGACVFYVRC